MAYEVWESKEDYDAFAAHLRPILAVEGITANQAFDIMEVVALGQ